MISTPHLWNPGDASFHSNTGRDKTSQPRRLQIVSRELNALRNRNILLACPEGKLLNPSFKIALSVCVQMAWLASEKFPGCRN